MELAIAAQLPMIAVTTSDRINLHPVIQHLTGKAIETDITKIKPNGLYVGPDNLPMPASMYADMVAKQATYVAVNLKKIPSYFFDAGEVPVPKALLKELLIAGLKDLKLVEKVMPLLAGLTITGAVEIARLTMARDGSLTQKGVTQTRHDVLGVVKGMTLVDTEEALYMPPSQLEAYVEVEKGYFLTGKDHRLMPKGLLLGGPTGTGKTAGVKYIAREFGVPLYRIDIGSTQQKWVGDSEANMDALLARLDEAAPCIALFDEIEKMLSGYATESTGIAGNLLAKLLWWQQEHRSRVLAAMTTNNMKALPPELLRPGRLDEVMTFNGLAKEEVFAFAEAVMNTFPEIMRVPVQSAMIPPTTNGYVSQAAVTVAVHKAIKAKPKGAKH